MNNTIAYQLIDSYKLGHADMFPVNTTKVYSNFTPRSLKYLKTPDGIKVKGVVVIGIQMFLRELVDTFDKTFFSVTPDWDEISEFFAPFCGPNGFNVDRLKQLHELGYLPLHIKAIPEGSIVPAGVPVLTVTNTLPQFAWLPNFLETVLSSDLWKPMTTATIALTYRLVAEHYARMTGGSQEFIQWQCHDFSSRGMSGMSDAGKAGVGHLVCFTGTDNITAVAMVNAMYRGKETFVGGSVPASEHSVSVSNILSISDEDFAKYEAEFDSRIGM